MHLYRPLFNCKLHWILWSLRSCNILFSLCTSTYQYLQSPDSTPASILAANPLGHVVRSPSRDIDTVDSGLLSVVERKQIETQQQQQQHNYSKPHQQHSPRYNSSTNTVGIHHSHHYLDSSLSQNTEHSSPPIRHKDDCDNARSDALSDLMANLSNGSDKSNNSPNSASAWQVLTISSSILRLCTLARKPVPSTTMRTAVCRYLRCSL